MKCTNCGQALLLGADRCSRCGAERSVYCNHCGMPVGASLTRCPHCEQPLPVAGTAPLASTAPRYTEPQGLFNIAVPPPWQIYDRNLLGIAYKVIDRSDVRSAGLRGMIQRAMAYGPAGLQMMFFPLPKGADLDALNQTYNNYLTKMAEQGGGVNWSAFDQPFNKTTIMLGEVPCLVLDYSHSVLGLSPTVERRFLTLANGEDSAMGVVIVSQNTPPEFQKWEKPLLEIATSFRFGTVAPKPDVQSNHLPGLRVPAADQALGWAFLYDLGQGDFAAARTAVISALEKRRDADTLSARAVVHLLQGEYASAMPLFEQAFAATSDPGRQAIVSALAVLTQRKRADETPDGLSIFFNESVQRWGQPIQEPAEWNKRYVTLLPQVKAPYAALEARWVGQILGMIQTWHSLVAGLNEKERAEQQKAFDQELGRMAQACDSQEAYALMRMAIAWIVDLHARTVAPLEAADRFQKLAGVFEAEKDPAGAAWSLLRRGDRLASPAPLGEPVLLGFRIKDQITNTTMDDDPKSFDRSGIDIAGARAAYTEAQKRYADGKMSRGEGLALSRLAYLEAVENHWQAARDDYAEAATRLGQAGDNLNQWAARVGELWAGLHLGEAEISLIESAKKLANEWQANEALATGLSFGLAMAYAGREALAMQGDVETALRAARIAEAIFVILNAPLRQAQTCADRAAAQEVLEAVEGSAAESEQALKLLQSAQAGSNAMAVKQVALQVAQKLMGIYAAQFDADGMERTQTLAHEFMIQVAEISEAEIESGIKTLGELQILLHAGQSGDITALAQVTALGGVEALQGIQEQALDFLTTFTLRENVRIIDEMAAFYIPWSRGLRAMEQGHGEVAAPYLQKALEIAAGRADRDLAEAEVYLVMRNFEQAQAALHRYVAAGMPGMYDRLEKVQNMLAAEVTSESSDATQRQQQINNHSLVAVHFERCQAWQAARDQWDQVESLAGPLALSSPVPRRTEINRLDDYGLIAEGLGDLKQARGYFEQALAGLEARRRMVRSDTLRRAMGGQRTIAAVYADYARVLADSEDWVKAFEIAEMLRARALTEAMSGAKAIARGLGSNTAYRSYIEQLALTEKLTTQLELTRHTEPLNGALEQELSTRLSEASAELDRRELALSQTYPRWRELAGLPSETIKMDELSKLLPNGTLLLAYLFSEERLLAWAVTRDGLAGQLSLKEFAGGPFLAHPFAASLRAQRLDPLYQTTLAKELLLPFDKFIADAGNIIVLPFADLALLSFHALPWRDRPLGLQKPVSYLPAASLLRFMRPPGQKSATALVVGDPARMARPNLATGLPVALKPLPGALVEARSVAGLYEVKPLTGEQASEEAVRKGLDQKPRIIHLATHGYLEPDVPLAAGVALANGEALSADEWMGLDLDADVVVLSACDTGSGDLQGNELVGLARALLFAGARASVVSLWEADDVAAALLMKNFHIQLKQFTPPAEALYRAQVYVSQVGELEAVDFCLEARAGAATQSEAELWETRCNRIQLRAEEEPRVFAEPRFWAAFELIGDWR